MKKFGLNFGLLFLRFGAGACMLIFHGAAKLGVIVDSLPINFPNPIGIGSVASFYLATFAEVVCSLMLILGIFTRATAAILSFNMFVALMWHCTNGGNAELALLYFVMFIALALSGGGKISLDSIACCSKLKK